MTSVGQTELLYNKPDIGDFSILFISRVIFKMMKMIEPLLFSYIEELVRKYLLKSLTVREKVDFVVKF